MVNRQSSSSTSTSSRSSQSSSYEEESSDAAMEIGKYWSTEAILARAIPNTAVVSAPPDASMLYEPRKLFTPYVSLGPVIGMVTESVARILVEVSVHSSVKCFLTDKFGVQHGREMKCPREKPVVFEFRELRQGTYYKVSFDIPVPGVVKSGFKTLNKNWSMAKHPARIAAVSSNNFHHRGRCVELDLWKHLYESCRKSEIDYLLHLGNVVFVDNPSSDSFNAYQEATEYCKESMSENSKIEPVVCEIFRNVYRDAWCHYTTRHVLANVPNLMTLGEHEIRQHSAEDSEAKLSFVDRCAYAVYNEYCRSLFENLPHSTKGYSTSSVSDSMRINQSYHFHAFGNLGILFLDTLAQSAFHHRSVEDLSTHHSLPFLGTKQWSDIQFALSPSGYLDNCKALLVCTSTPIAHTGVPGLMGIKNIEGTWNARENISEASLILEKLFEWKAAKHGRRNIALLSGSVTDAGVTEIVDLVYKDQGEKAIERIKQITCGPIESPALPNRPSLSHAGTSVTNLGKDHQFKHVNIIKNTRNYAVIDITDPKSSSGPLFTFRHVTVANTEDSLVISEPINSNTYISGCWAKAPTN